MGDEIRIRLINRGMRFFPQLCTLFKFKEEDKAFWRGGWDTSFDFNHAEGMKIMEELKASPLCEIVDVDNDMDGTRRYYVDVR